MLQFITSPGPLVKFDLVTSSGQVALLVVADVHPVSAPLAQPPCVQSPGSDEEHAHPLAWHGGRAGHLLE